MNFFLLLRPFNFFFVMLTVYYGAIFGKALSFSLPIFFAMLSAACIAGAGYTINDVFDFQIDKLNKPQRVLPRGKISLKAAYHFALFLFVFGISMSFFTGKTINVAIAVMNSLLLFYYAKKYKMKFLSGNLIVAYTSASTFLYGGITNANLKASFYVSIFAFFYTMIREIIKDLEDKRADETYGATTLPIRYGIKKAITIVYIPAIIILIYASWYFLFFMKNLLSFSLFFLIVIFPLFTMIFYVKKKPQISVFKKVSGLMKADMLALLIILILG